MTTSKSKQLQNNEILESCLICNKQLTIHNSVTPLCKHTHCYECFWKWAEKNDTCPFCRNKLIPRNRKKELEMVNLLERRREVRTNLEDLYNEYEIKKSHYKIINKKVISLGNQKKNLNILISELEYKYGYIEKKIKYKFKFFNKLRSWKNDPLLGIKYFEQIYKLKLKLKLYICFQEIKYNIKYNNILFWKKLSKKWNKKFLFNEKEENNFKNIFSNFHIYRNFKNRIYNKKKSSTSSFSTSLIDLENIEEYENYYNVIVEI